MAQPGSFLWCITPEIKFLQINYRAALHRDWNKSFWSGVSLTSPIATKLHCNTQQIMIIIKHAWQWLFAHAGAKQQKIGREITVLWRPSSQIREYSGRSLWHFFPKWPWSVSLQVSINLCSAEYVRWNHQNRWELLRTFWQSGHGRHVPHLEVPSPLWELPWSRQDSYVHVNSFHPFVNVCKIPKHVEWCLSWSAHNQKKEHVWNSLRKQMENKCFFICNGYCFCMYSCVFAWKNSAKLKHFRQNVVFPAQPETDAFHCFRIWSFWGGFFLTSIAEDREGPQVVCGQSTEIYLANTSVPFPTCPNCQISDTDTIWLLVIGSQSKFGNLVWYLCHRSGNWGTALVNLLNLPSVLKCLPCGFLRLCPAEVSEGRVHFTTHWAYLTLSLLVYLPFSCFGRSLVCAEHRLP